MGVGLQLRRDAARASSSRTSATRRRCTSWSGMGFRVVSGDVVSHRRGAHRRRRARGHHVRRSRAGARRRRPALHDAVPCSATTHERRVSTLSSGLSPGTRSCDERWTDSGRVSAVRDRQASPASGHTLLAERAADYLRAGPAIRQTLIASVCQLSALPADDRGAHGGSRCSASIRASSRAARWRLASSAEPRRTRVARARADDEPLLSSLSVRRRGRRDDRGARR